MSDRLTQPQIIDSLLVGNLTNETYTDGIDNFVKIKINNVEYLLKLTNPTPTPTVTPTITPTMTVTPTVTPPPSVTPTLTPTVTPSA